MKTLANCTPVEFLRQTNKIRHAASDLLKESGVFEIRKTRPDFTGSETKEERDEKLQEQAKKNLNEILDSLMDTHAEKTATVLGMMCFMEPKEIEKASSMDFLSASIELLNSKPVLDFLSSLMRSGQKNTDG